MGKVTIVTVVVVRESLLEWQTLNWMLYLGHVPNPDTGSVQ